MQIKELCLKLGTQRRLERGETRIIYASESCPLRRCSACLLLSNSLNRRSLAIAARSPVICLTPCGTCWRSLSALGASYSIPIHACQKNPSVEPRQLLLPGSTRWDFCKGSAVLYPLPTRSEKRDHRLKDLAQIRRLLS